MNKYKFLLFSFLLFFHHSYSSETGKCNPSELDKLASQADFSIPRFSDGVDLLCDQRRIKEGSRGRRIISDPSHPSVFPGNTTKRLISREKSLAAINRMCADGLPCVGGFPENMQVIQDQVNDRVFYSLFGRQNAAKKATLGGDILATPYVASATDPVTGVYSIKENIMPVGKETPELIEEVLTSQVQKSSTSISEGINDLIENKREYISEDQVSGKFKDGQYKDMWVADGVKNGHTGTHAEVLAANSLLRFKDDVYSCLQTKSCEGALSCLPNCDLNSWQDIAKIYEVSIPRGFMDNCGTKPKKCFPEPPSGGHQASGLFFDIRGAKVTSVTAAIDARDQLKKFPGYNLSVELRQLSRKVKPDDYKKKFLLDNSVPSDLVDKVYGEIVRECRGKRPGCDVAYLRSVAFMCKEYPSKCAEADISLAQSKRVVTAKVIGKEFSSEEIIEFGAGHRCFHCWHILGRQNFTSTLENGVEP